MAIEHDPKRIDKPAPWSMKLAVPGHLRVREGERVVKFVVAIQREYCETGGNSKTANGGGGEIFFFLIVVAGEILCRMAGKKEAPPARVKNPTTRKTTPAP